MKNSLFILIIIVCSFVYADWESIGPAGGNLRAMAQAPSNESIVYAAAFINSCQIVKSIDAGGSWERLSSMPDYVYCLVVDPDDPDIVYAGSDSKIFKSTTGGTNWSSYPVSDYHIYDLEIHGSQPSVISAVGAVKNGAYYYMSYFKSINGGLIWSSKQLLFNKKSCSYCIAIDPADPNTIFVNGSILDSIKNPLIFKSTNGGTDFSDVSSGFSPCSIACALAIHPTNSSIVYFSTDAGIYRSTDSGSSWSLTCPNQNVFSLGTSLAEPDIVFAGADTTVYKSTDAGESWFQPGSGFYGKEIHNLTVSQVSASDIYAGNNVGFFKTTTGGSSWFESNNNMNINAIHNFAVAPSSSSIIYMEIDDVGEFKSTNSGTNWILLPEFLSCGDICAFAIHNTDPDYVFALEGKG